MVNRSVTVTEAIDRFPVSKITHDSNSRFYGPDDVIEPHDDIAKIRPVTQAKIIQGLKPQKILPVSQGQKMPVYPTKAPVSATLSAQ